MYLTWLGTYCPVRNLLMRQVLPPPWWPSTSTEQVSIVLVARSHLTLPTVRPQLSRRSYLPPATQHRSSSHLSSQHHHNYFLCRDNHQIPNVFIVNFEVVITTTEGCRPCQQPIRDDNGVISRLYYRELETTGRKPSKKRERDAPVRQTYSNLQPL